MKIYLRLSEVAKKTLKLTKNNMFVSETSEEFTLFPIPPFLKNPLCRCGKVAQFMLGDMSYICSKCMNKSLKKTKLIKKDDISISLTEHTIKRIKFEWSVDGDRWYTIYGRGLKPRDWNWFLRKLRKAVLNDTELDLEADYDKDRKEMTIY